MKRLIQGLAMASLVCVLLASPAPAGENTWVSEAGTVHALHSGNAVFVSEDGAERFDISELKDGETRTFGAGPRAVTVRRSGDAATISRNSSGDDVSAIDITCRLADDTCTVLTFPNDPERVMVAIEKERICENGEGDCDFMLGEGVVSGGNIVVDIECEDNEEDCGEIHRMHLDGLAELQGIMEVETEGRGDGEQSRIVIRRIGGDGENVFVTKAGVGGPAAMHRMHALHGDQVMLRCSEGDATITVKKEEAGDTFLCPKHSTPMEAVKGHAGRGIRVIRESAPRED